MTTHPDAESGNFGSAAIGRKFKGSATMKFMTRTITTLLALLAFSGCTLQEVQKFSYNSGNNIGCRQAKDNLPTEKQLDFDCLYQQGNDMSYERYIELRNERDRN